MNTQNHDQKAGQLDEKQKDAKISARVSLMPEVNATSVIHTHLKNLGKPPNMFAISEVIGETIKKVQDGDLKQSEGMLMAQAFALESIFTSLACVANDQENVQVMQTILRLALKAQNQCRTTLETLANMKNPPVLYTKQANISGGHQMVNNGVVFSSSEMAISTNSPEKTFSSNELLEQQHEQWLDTGTTSTASNIDPQLETME